MKIFLNVEYSVTIKEIVSDEYVFNTTCVSEEIIVKILKLLGCEDWEINLRLEDYRKREEKNDES